MSETTFELPAITGEVSSGRILRQHAGKGDIGDTEINLSTTAGIGGFSLIIEVKPPKGETVYVVYNGQKIVEEVARAVIDGKIKPAPKPTPKKGQADE